MTTPVFRSLDRDAFEYGRVDQVSPMVRRVIADNPSKFTYCGTGTYIVGHGDVVVIDPGPRLDSHRDALAAALAGERVRAILITHCHSDHSPLAAWLHAESGAPTFAFGPHPVPDPTWDRLSEDSPPEPGELEESGDSDAPGDRIGTVEVEVELEETTDFEFRPTHAVSDGERVVEFSGWSMTAMHTPGHTSNHMCWMLDADRASGAERAVFTGDHVMGWSTTVVSPPDGDMAEYIESLRRVAELCEASGDRTLWPTHGPPRDDGAQYVRALVEHRLERERGVLSALDAGDTTIAEIVERLYVATPRRLHRAARRSVWGHLLKLVSDGQVEVIGSSEPALLAWYRRNAGASRSSGS